MKKSQLYTDQDMDDFMGGNSMEFLGLLPGGKNRDRLEKFYEKHGMEPPKWFKESV